MFPDGAISQTSNKEYNEVTEIRYVRFVVFYLERRERITEPSRDHRDRTWYLESISWVRNLMVFLRKKQQVIMRSIKDVHKMNAYDRDSVYPPTLHIFELENHWTDFD
jgi:hypothetical protein